MKLPCAAARFPLFQILSFTSPDNRKIILLTSVALFAALQASHATDADSDGIPADWELLRGTSDSDPADAAQDWDGDGLSLFLEYLTQGRPWGNYTLRRFPFASLPMDLSPSAITASEIAALNRAGEVIVNFTTSSSVRTFLWTPPGGPLSSPELVEVPYAGAAPLLFNDLGEVLVAGTGTADIRNLRDSEVEDIEVTWPDGSASVALALSNGHQVLVRTTFAGTTPFVSPADRYQWYDAEGATSGTAEIHYDVSNHYFTSGAAPDATGGAWLWGLSLENVFPFSIADQMSAWLPVDDSAEAVTLSGALHGAAFLGGAGNFAIGTVWNDALDAYQHVRLGPDGPVVIEGDLPGSEPELFGITEDGLVAGWNYDLSPAESFLWKETAVSIEKARVEVAGGIGVTGLSAAGVLHGLDFGVSSPLPPQPVVFQPALSAPHDGAADEGGALTDSDGDGIPDARESAAGTNSSLADSDGDGIADLWELLAGTDPAVAPAAPSPGSTGLSVFTPASHPLRRVVGLP